MVIQKRTLPKYIILNCLTLGIYGFIVSQKINKEINALCKGDGERPKFTYAGAVLIRGIAPILGIIVGLIIGLIGIGGRSIFSLLPWMGGHNAIAVFTSILFGGVLFTFVGSLISGIYLNFWWYKQAGRLKLNANRYGITVKESGVDNFIFRTVMQVILLPITVVLYALSFAIPLLIVWLIALIGSIGAVIFAWILLLIFSIPLMFFGMELTAGANFATYFVFKNLNRYADVCRNGAAPFDPMAYEYYPSVENQCSGFVPGLVNGSVSSTSGSANNSIQSGEEVSTGVLINTGSISGIKGSCAGYNFELTSGEEIVIGKDAKVSMVVIDPAYKEISRKHVGVCYDVVRDQYRVVDYSSNGTWANGNKLVAGQAVYLPHGTELKLANDKNIFRLG